MRQVTHTVNIRRPLRSGCVAASQSTRASGPSRCSCCYLAGRPSNTLQLPAASSIDCACRGSPIVSSALHMSTSRTRRPPRASSSAALKVGDQAESRMDCSRGNGPGMQVAVSVAQRLLTGGLQMAAPRTLRCAANATQAKAGKQGEQTHTSKEENTSKARKNNGINPPGLLTGWRHRPRPACRASRTAGSAGTARPPALGSRGRRGEIGAWRGTVYFCQAMQRRDELPKWLHLAPPASPRTSAAAQPRHPSASPTNRLQCHWN